MISPTCGCEDEPKGNGLCKYHYVTVYRLDHAEEKRAHARAWASRNRQKRTEYFRLYRQTPEGRAAQQRAIDKYEAKNAIRKKAWKKVYRSKLLKLPCAVCGDESVHAHHPDPLKELEIVYLCPLHHRKVHVL